MKRILGVFLCFFISAIPLKGAESPDHHSIVIEEIQNRDNIPGLRVKFYIRAAREKIWQTLNDYKNFTRVFTNIDDLKVQNEHDQGATVKFRIKVSIFRFSYVLDRRYEIPLYKVSWTRKSGSMQVIEGSWEILDTNDPDIKQIIYTSYVGWDFIIIDSVIRQLAKKEGNKMAVRLKAYIENNQ